MTNNVSNTLAKPAMNTRMAKWEDVRNETNLEILNETNKETLSISEVFVNEAPTESKELVQHSDVSVNELSVEPKKEFVSLLDELGSRTVAHPSRKTMKKDKSPVLPVKGLNFRFRSRNETPVSSRMEKRKSKKFTMIVKSIILGGTLVLVLCLVPFVSSSFDHSEAATNKIVNHVPTKLSSSTGHTLSLKVTNLSKKQLDDVKQRKMAQALKENETPVAKTESHSVSTQPVQPVRQKRAYHSTHVTAVSTPQSVEKKPVVSSVNVKKPVAAVSTTPTQHVTRTVSTPVVHSTKSATPVQKPTVSSAVTNQETKKTSQAVSVKQPVSAPSVQKHDVVKPVSSVQKETTHAVAPVSQPTKVTQTKPVTQPVTKPTVQQPAKAQATVPATTKPAQSAQAVAQTPKTTPVVKTVPTPAKPVIVESREAVSLEDDFIYEGSNGKSIRVNDGSRTVVIDYSIKGTKENLSELYVGGNVHVVYHEILVNNQKVNVLDSIDLMPARGANHALYVGKNDPTFVEMYVEDMVEEFNYQHVQSQVAKIPPHTKVWFTYKEINGVKYLTAISVDND